MCGVNIKIFIIMANHLTSLEISNALNDSNFLELLEQRTNLKFDRDAQNWHEIESFIFEQLNQIIL